MSTNKLKILYVITQGEWGGAQRYVYDLATKLDDNFDVFVAVGEPNGGKEMINKLQITNYKLQINDKIQIIQLEHLKRNISIIHDILAIFELAKLYKKIKPNIIHLNSTKAGVIGSLAKLLTKLDSRWSLPRTAMRGGNDTMKVIYTVHGWVFNEPTRKLGRILYRFLEKLTAKIKNKIIVLSDRDYKDGLDLKIDKNKLVKIPLGIEKPDFLDKEIARESLSQISNFKFQISNFLVGTIANLYPSKGLDILVEAVGIINNSYKLQVTSYKLQFVIIGEGPERKNLESRIKNYELGDAVYLTGAIENASQYLKAFDLFVLPSRKEGLPYTILEAIAAEIPIVATDVGGVAELVENTVQPDNPKKLAEAIVTALNNPPPTKNNALTIEKMVEETKKLYFIQ